MTAAPTEFDEAAAETEAQPDYESAVALVGMAGRFPGASSVARLWENLSRGTGGLRAIEDEEAIAAGLDPAVLADPNYVRVGGPVEGVDQFDAAAFGFTDLEAELMEPQHRLLLECAWEALEGAGYRPTEPDGVVGIYAGCSFPEYMLRNLPKAKDPEVAKSFAAGNERDSLTSLVSYKLGLRGPGVTVQSFCSTSLVAVHLACQSLLTYETDLALAGGASLPLPQPAGYLYRPGGIYSPDGRVRPFDAESNGTVMGSGVGVVALKRMADALADGDEIHAVILGSAVNNDGRERAGYSAPGVDGQAEVIEAALTVAGVKPESIGYLECHAVGTPLGDSIELAALGRVFKEPAGPWVLGSVKPAVGHLDCASGVTALIRTALSLRHAVLPGVPGFETPNPALAAAGGRFTVLQRDRPWPAGPEPRRAGVSSFGVGGTNAHLVLEEAPARTPRLPGPGPHLLAFSAGDEQALEELTERLREHLLEPREEAPNLADVAYTLQVSRGRFALRRAVVCSDVDDAISALANPRRWIDGVTTRRDPRVRLLVPQGAPEPAWQEIGVAAASLLSPDGAAQRPEDFDRPAALDALRTGLNRLGARITDDDAAAAAAAAAASANQDTKDVVELVVDPGPGGAAEWIVTALARLWLEGSPIDWAALHRGAGRRVELPTYPFQRRRHWTELTTTSTSDTQTLSTNLGTRAYRPTWRPRPRPIADLDSRLRAAGPWLLLGGDARTSALERRLLTAGAEVMTAESSEILRDLIVAPRLVVHAGTTEGAATLEDAVRQVLPSTTPSLVFLTSQAVGVSGADLLHPEQAPIAELAARIGARHIDVGAHTDVDQTLAAMVHDYEGPTAVRGADAWVRDFELLDHDAPNENQPELRSDHTVVIVGGLDGVGLELARQLAHEWQCRLALIGPSDTTSSLAELEADGTEVLVLSTDLGDEEAVRTALSTAVQRLGGADVIVYAASHGFEALHGALDAVRDQETECRLVALCPSSPTSATTAAHAHAARQRGEGRWLTLSWGSWHESDLDGALNALPFFEAALAASDHLAQIVIAHGSPRRELAATSPTDTTEGGRSHRPNLAVAYVEPAEDLEQSIADAWMRALNVEPIGADDNFFELGGRSITAIQLAVSIGAAQSVALPATAVVECPTVRALADRIRELSALV